VKRPTWFLLLTILLIAAGLRFYQVAEMSLRADEAVNILFAVKEPGEIIRTFVSDDPHQPLYYLILHFWMLPAGRSELAARYPAIFASIVLVALVYALGRQIFPRRPAIALTAAALAAINPSLIWDAQDAYMYSSLSLATVVSFIAFLRVMQTDASGAKWTAYVVASAAGLYFHYFAAFALIAQGVVWVFFILTRQISRHKMVAWILANIVVVILFLPWLVLAFPMLASFKPDFLPAFSWWEMLARSLTSFTVGRTDPRLLPAVVEPQIGSVLSVGFLSVFVYGLAAPSTTIKDDLARWVLIIYLFGALLTFFLFSLWRFPVFDERYVLFLIPVFELILARGLVILQERIRWKWIPASAFAFIVLASVNSLCNYFYVPAFSKSPAWRGFMQRLLAESQPGDVLIQNYPDPALPYYLQDRMPRVLLPRSGSATAAEVSADLNRLTAKYSRVWFQPAPFAEWDTGGLVAAWLSRHARRVSAFEFRGVQLEMYLPASVALRQAKPMDAIFAGQIELVAFDLDAPARALRPGTTAHVILYWKAHARLERAATVFVHLYGADGRLWSQQDNQPVNGTYPTSDWETETIVVDEYYLTIPADAPPGTYSVEVGMYDSQTQERLIATDHRGQPFPQNRVPLLRVGW